MTQTLFDRIGTVRTGIGLLFNRRKNKEQARHFEMRAQQLNGPTQTLTVTASNASILQRSGIAIVGIKREALVRLKTQLKTLETNFNNDANSILDPYPGQDVRKILFDPLTVFSSETDILLRNCWKSWVQEEEPQIANELLQVLTAVPAFSEPVAAIREAQSKLRRAGTALPSKPEDVESIRAMVQRLDATWLSVTGEGIPEQVVAFLRVAGQREGAPLSMLTTDVRDWLTQHSILHSLRIRLS